jgi:predicted transcriptional regulator of viral defense system
MKSGAPEVLRITTAKTGCSSGVMVVESQAISTVSFSGVFSSAAATTLHAATQTMPHPVAIAIERNDEDTLIVAPHMLRGPHRHARKSTFGRG